jgi:exonuclease III
LAGLYQCRSPQGSTHPRWSASPASTYWDYPQLRFPRREGMRIDVVLGSPALAARVGGARIDREERKGKGASDHASVVVELTS